MAEVNFERAWFRLKERLGDRRSWGIQQIDELLRELEVENLIPEGEASFDARPASPRNGASPQPPAHELPADGREPVMASH